MNNKGFTLIEVLAVVVILSLVMVLAGRGVLTAIENSKFKSEEIFVDKVASTIDDYLDYATLNGDIFVKSSSASEIVFDKCYAYIGEGDERKCKIDSSVSAVAYLMTKSDGSYITLKDLVDSDAKLINENDLVNPRTKEQCKNLDSTNIYLFKDSDYVYYYFVDLANSCGVREKTNDVEDYVNIISTLPDTFCSQSIEEGIESNRSILNNILGVDTTEKICGEEIAIGEEEILDE